MQFEPWASDLLFKFAIPLFTVIISFSLGLITNVRKWINENKKLQIENERLMIENKRMLYECQKLGEQISVWKSEKKRLDKESEKIESDLDLIRRQPKEAKLTKIKILLSRIENSNLKIVAQSHQPIEVFLSIHRIHNLLQNQTELIVEDPVIEESLKNIKQLTHLVQTRVMNRCPVLIAYARELENNPQDSEHKQLKWLSDINRDMSCGEAIKLIFEKHKEILEQINRMSERYQILRSEF